MRGVGLPWLSVLTAVFLSRPGNCSEERRPCPIQPQVMDILFNKMGVLSECIFKSSLQLDDFQFRNSTLLVREKQAVPDSQGWSRCQHCGWFDSQFHLYNSALNESSGDTPSIDLSWSLWGEFFFNKKNDKLKASTGSWSELQALRHCEDEKDRSHSSSSSQECIKAQLAGNERQMHSIGTDRELPKSFYVVDRPVYILPMITLHVGHIIIDLLEQVYHSMIEHYGRVRTDALIIIDVAPEDERGVLQEKIFLNTRSHEYDTFGAVINLLTDLPILSMDNLRYFTSSSSSSSSSATDTAALWPLFPGKRSAEVTGTPPMIKDMVQGAFVMFEDVHIGLDLSQSFFNRGYDLHPCVFTDPSVYGVAASDSKVGSNGSSTRTSTPTSSLGDTDAVGGSSSRSSSRDANIGAGAGMLHDRDTNRDRDKDTEVARMSARYKSFRNHLTATATSGGVPPPPPTDNHHQHKTNSSSSSSNDCSNNDHTEAGAGEQATQQGHAEDNSQPERREEQDRSQHSRRRCINSEDITSEYWPEVAQFNRQQQQYQQQQINSDDGSGSSSTDYSAANYSAASVVKVLIIQRDKNRAILNLDHLISVLTRLSLSEDGSHPQHSTVVRRRSSVKWATAVVEITAVPFSKQTCLFAEADVLIAVAGTAVHNILFMKPGAAVVILMQPHWCPWSWMYANQAVLLDIQPLVYCSRDSTKVSYHGDSYSNNDSGDYNDDKSGGDATDNGSDSANSDSDRREVESIEDRRRTEYIRTKDEGDVFHWTRHTWLQGPRMSKSDNVYVDADEFEGLLHSIIVPKLPSVVAAAQASRDTEGSIPSQSRDGEDEYDIGRWDRDTLLSVKRAPPPMCFGRPPPTTATTTTAAATTTTSGASSSHTRTRRSGNDDKNAAGGNGNNLDMLNPDAYDPSRPIEVYVSAVKVLPQEYDGTSTDTHTPGTDTHTTKPKEWKVGLMGEFRTAPGQAEAIFRSLPHISICLQSLMTLSPPWCQPVEGFNYYSDVWLTVTEPVHLLHLWAQMSPQGGKIRGSDTYFALDTTLPVISAGGVYTSSEAPWQGGIDIHSEALGLEIFHEVELKVRVEQSDSAAENNVTDQVERVIKTITFHRKLQNRRSLQRATADFCVASSLNHIGCGQLMAQLTNRANRQVLAKLMGLPDIQVMPTPSKPFVFVHIEKTGGTTLREFITEAADRLGIEYFVPCHGDIHCVTLSLSQADNYLNSGEPNPYVEIPRNPDGTPVGDTARVQLSPTPAATGTATTTPAYKADTEEVLNSKQNQGGSQSDLKGNNVPIRDLTNVSIVAGHFFWDVWQDLPKPAVDTTENGYDGKLMNRRPRRRTPPCFVMGRHPLERAISYYYQRCYDSEACVGYRRRINDLQPEELLHIAQHERQGKLAGDNQTLVIVDEGMENAACRALANEKHTTGLVIGRDDLTLPPPISEDAERRAMENLPHCVVGILERWAETKKVLKFWFPWIDFSYQAERRKMHIYSGKERKGDLRPEIRQVLEMTNSCDLKLYAKMQEIFEKELSVVNTRSFAI